MRHYNIKNIRRIIFPPSIFYILMRLQGLYQKTVLKLEGVQSVTGQISWTHCKHKNTMNLWHQWWHKLFRGVISGSCP